MLAVWATKVLILSTMKLLLVSNHVWCVYQNCLKLHRNICDVHFEFLQTINAWYKKLTIQKRYRVQTESYSVIYIHETYSSHASESYLRKTVLLTKQIPEKKRKAIRLLTTEAFIKKYKRKMH